MPAFADSGLPDPKPLPKSSGSPSSDPSTRVPDPVRKLGKSWDTSMDRAVTTAADSGGFKVLVADSKDAYQWRTVATLAEPGMPADSWIGNSCVMDRDHAAVVYAPRTFTNKPDLMQGGAFTAVVDLKSGRVTKLPFTGSLAYFDPSCNAETGTAAFTAFRDSRTRLVTVDTSGRTTTDISVTGQVTSAVPTQDGLVAAHGRHLVHVDPADSKLQKLAAANGVPFDIRPTSEGIAFLDRSGNTAHAKLWKGRGTPSLLASGKLGDLALEQGAEGQAFLTGDTTHANLAGTGVTRLDVAADTDVSSHGRLAVDPVLMPGVRAGLERIGSAGKGFTKAEPSPRARITEDPTRGSTAPLTITSVATATGEKITQAVTDTTSDTGKGSFSPALRAAGGTGKNGRAAQADELSHNPVDTDRWCSVPRNDVKALALQPTPNQVEWAVNMAIRGELRAKWIKQGGWRSQAGLGTVDPQGLFPAPTLKGKAGSRIPAQVLLGVLAQESNLWQAEGGAIPGQMGNPQAAIAGFYGHKGETSEEYWAIKWHLSDCGYGVGQVTDGMRLAGYEKPNETSLPPAKQKGVALDYAINIAASMYILADKWNQVHTEGQTITVNNDDASKPENWFAALWNYNLGFNPNNGDGKPWGLGWYNNPANPFYPPSRFPFMSDPRDAAKPQNWPYQEKVMGWAAWSMDTGYSYSTDGRQDWPGESGFSSAGFRPAWWVSEGQRDLVKPPLDAFCNATNNCDSANPPDCPDEDCYKRYWWRGSNVTWKRNCANDCGNENIKYVTLREEPGRGYRLRSGTPQCDRNGLPSTALIVDSLPDNTETYGDCGSSGTDTGSFQFTFHPNPAATGPGLGPYEAKGDLHQIGGGHGGHFWYTHTRDTAHLGGTGARMTIDGTWTLDRNTEWTRVFAHQPDTGAHTQQAHYVIKGVAGGDRHRYVNTHFGTNTWVELGVYRFTGTPRVELTNTTADGTADEDVAWDAVAFQPLTGKPKHMVVAMGDSYTSGEGAGAYSPESDRDHGESSWNACRRSANAWPRKVILPGQTKSVGTLADSLDPALDFQFIACSGAKTFQLTEGDPNVWGRDGNFHEKTQIDSGVLSEDTTAVMLTIGGNDARFDNKIQKCVMEGCLPEASMKADIDAAVAETWTVLEQIHNRAPNATISLMGYPLLFSRTQACSTLVSASQRVILNDMAQYFEDEQRELALSMSAYNVKYRSPQSAFEGKRICDSPEGINGVVAGPKGDGDFHHGDEVTQLCWWFTGGTCLSRESYHPNQTGTGAYAQAFMTASPMAAVTRKEQ
ncbi:GDSL-type esterase/lipase family protein [Streptomyces beigongshangae]|uniref:GDSL-type esterase/lipase family protein n=1 Tax=Streptomyces beigongshangae TaxID=2841597 RepID=UPI0027DFE7F2|nr:GDSL-type esterase/lipase family protein [Streptomyces sp. REN17]